MSIRTTLDNNSLKQTDQLAAYLRQTSEMYYIATYLIVKTIIN